MQSLRDFESRVEVARYGLNTNTSQTMRLPAPHWRTALRLTFALTASYAMTAVLPPSNPLRKDNIMATLDAELIR